MYILGNIMVCYFILNSFKTVKRKGEVYKVKRIIPAETKKS